MNRCHCAALYDCDHHTEAAFRALEEARFETGEISLLGPPRGGVREAACGRPLWSDKTGFWRQDVAGQAGLWGHVGELAWVAIPDIGTLAVAGPVVAVFCDLAAREVGCGALAQALIRIGIPCDTTSHYEAALCAGRFLLVMPGNRHEVECCHALLARLEAIDLSVHLQ